MNTRCALAAMVILLVVGAALRGDPPPSDAKGFRWVDKDTSIELLRGSRPVVEYMCAPYDDSSAETRFATCKVYHHVFSPDGSVRLTKGDTGGLYPHHRGLFFGFNKVTYGDGKQCDIWHCKDGAYQSHEGVIGQFGADGSVGHTVAIDWHGVGGELFAHERRTVAVRTAEPSPSPSLQGRVIQIDWSSHLETADGRPIHLDGDPQHAGFHFRAAREVADKTAAQTYYLRTDGRGGLGETRNWEAGGGSEEASYGAMNAECTNRPWDAMSVVEGGRRYTILYLDHPDNPKPARYSERDYGRFGSYFVCDVTAERPLDVRYRIWVQAGETTVEGCAAKYREFAAAPGR